MSTVDPNDPKEVVSVRLKDKNNKRIDTIHTHEDGTSHYRSGSWSRILGSISEDGAGGF